MPTTCPLTTDVDDSGQCDVGAGGVRAVYFCESYNKLTCVVIAGVVTAMTLVATKVFRRYIPKNNTANWVDPIVVEPVSGAYSYKPVITFPLYSLETTVRQEVQLLARNATMIVVLDNQGVYRLFGKEHFMKMTGADVNGGTAMSDGTRKQALTFSGEETEHAPQITSSVILAALGIVAP